MSTIPNCGLTYCEIGGHTQGCGVCPECIESEQRERRAEDEEFRRWANFDTLRRNIARMITTCTGCNLPDEINYLPIAKPM